jgi:hypothetical protein
MAKGREKRTEPNSREPDFRGMLALHAVILPLPQRRGTSFACLRIDGPLLDSPERSAHARDLRHLRCLCMNPVSSGEARV